MINVKAIITSKAFQLGVIAGVSGTISAFISYHVTKRRLDQEYRAIVDKEILEARKFYSALNKRDAFASPELVMKEVGLTQAAQALNNYQGLAQAGKPESEEEFKRLRQGNWTTPDESVDNLTFYPGFKAEETVIEQNEHSTIRPISSLSERRHPTEPYILTEEEFMEATDADARQQITLTFYADDDVLADDKDLPVEDIAHTIGIENLTQFGNGSNDPRIVYIRNERIDVDFEVILDKGNYAEIVHGISKEPRRRAKRFRGDHE